ncbi:MULTISPECIES: LysR substrate-binding domain-containing protein [Albidovulum]|uniref:LysR substrate-binding domain-containing protein n=1 Tax=Defluviimonas salinarum TaxID=2992147 RepID=A0ABT3J9U3_9RHOB|nr:MULTISPECIES: LysR substrate-binding domain-containing protein [Defluviimonas]MCW3784468.1 LysR substrate-binding domain-containing protein [Defluviimonas salinarum]
MSELRSLIPSPHSLFVFEAAARHLNFKNAAAELNVTQPSVSQSIRALERHCGTQLFIRENRGVQLTEAGRLLYDSVRFGFHRIEESLRTLSSTETRYLTFAASTSVAAHWLMPQLYKLQQDHPNLRIKVVTTDRDIEPDSEIDLTIWIRDRDFRRPNSWYLCDEVVFPICAPKYLADHPCIGTVSDLTNHRRLHAFDRFRKRMSWAEWLARVGVETDETQPDMVFNDYQLTLQAALAGEGLALGWSLTSALLLHNTQLVRPLPTEINTGNAFFLIAAPGATLTGELDALIAWIRAQTADLSKGQGR